MTPPLHIVHTINGLREDHGGPSRSVAELSGAMTRQGTSVTVVAGHASDDVVVHPKGAHLELAPRPGPLGLVRPHQSAFAQVLNDALPASDTAASVIYNHGLWLPCNHIAAAVGRRRNIPFVVGLIGTVSEWALSQSSTRKKLAWAFYQRRDLAGAALLLATSSIEAAAAERLGLNLPIATIPHGVSLPEDLPTRKASPARTALFLGRLHPVKGLLDLIQAWAQIRPEGWRLVLAGPDEDGHQAELERAAAEAGLSDVVSFPGAVADGAKWTLYADADLFVLPSHSENFGIVVAEALAAHVPVLTTKGTPWSDLPEYRCGWWSEVGTDGVGAALREATSLPVDMLREMGSNGRALVEERYSWNRAAAQTIEAYQWLLGRQPRPTFVTDGRS